MKGDLNLPTGGVRKVIIAMDGVGGTGIMPQTLGLAMKMAGTDHVVEKFFWTHGLGRPIRDLQDRENIEKKSYELYELLQRLKAEGCSVQVVAKSGGSIIAIKALERLPAGTIGDVVLLSPAISPGYDLSRALTAIDRRMFCFYSNLDRVYLSLGTSIFGTSDGVKGNSAGLVGFLHPPPEPFDVDQYGKLEQVPWEPTMLTRLHIGMHLGNSMLPWLLKYVVPVLRCEEQSALASISN